MGAMRAAGMPEDDVVRELNYRATRLAYRGLRCPNDGRCDPYVPCAACRARDGGVVRDAPPVTSSLAGESTALQVIATVAVRLLHHRPGLW
ncbi:MAG: hypothetical protein QOD35_436 [Nocardioidaceae bacterium]|nr:hypothetical protein [Nocardioidaceae bacterium]